MTCPNQERRWLFIFSTIGATFILPLIYSFRILSFLVTPHIHLNIRISVTCILFSSHTLVAQHSAPYNITGLMTLLYILPLILIGILRSHVVPVSCFHFIHPAFIRLVTSLSILPSLCRREPRYRKSSPTASGEVPRDIDAAEVGPPN
ncbi:hypothetical protein JYU34_005701 [Plutella xylostella]|uniref:Uncharacterized protein n=1 Tax=Plutella xylostella TaxID=51655 RepID=A0ABQ7QTW5_PLUXY|nr:hypothetical protein JYU34_005701 [Plutella xylostella]